MLIGITFDLREQYLAAGYSEEETAEFDQPRTIEAIEDTLLSLGHEADRIGSGTRLVERLAAGERWDLVFNISEGLHGNAREAQVPAILDLYQIPYTFSDPLILAVALDKGITNQLVRALGIRTADFAVARDEAELEAIALPPPLHVKPVAEGTGKGVTSSSVVENRRELAQQVRQIWERYGQGALVETFLPGREFTVALLGTGAEARILGVLEIELREGADPLVYSYRNKEECEGLVNYSLPADDLALEAGDLALAAWRGLGCRDAGRVDVRADAFGQPTFLEVNPLAGLHPEHSDLPIICSLRGIPYTELIGEILRSAASRESIAEAAAAPAEIAPPGPTRTVVPAGPRSRHRF